MWESQIIRPPRCRPFGAFLGQAVHGRSALMLQTGVVVGSAVSRSGSGLTLAWWIDPGRHT
jgi:hypothetical protein